MKNLVLQHENIGFVRIIHNLDKIVFRAINDKLVKYNISHVQALIIIYIYNNIEKDIFQKDLEKEFGLTNPTVTASIKSMESKELITKVKSKNDGRYYVLSLTEKGNKLAPKCTAIYELLEKEINLMLTDEERLMIYSLYDRISQQYKK